MMEDESHSVLCAMNKFLYNESNYYSMGEIDAEEVEEIVQEWRKRAEMMEEVIENPRQVQQTVIGQFKARANELEIKLLGNE